MKTGYEVAYEELKKRGMGYPSQNFMFKIKYAYIDEKGVPFYNEITYEYGKLNEWDEDEPLFFPEDWWEGQQLVEVLAIYDIDKIIQEVEHNDK